MSPLVPRSARGLALCLFLAVRVLVTQPVSAEPNGPLPSAGAARAPDQDAAWIEREAQKIAGTTMSPFCPGRTLADCPSPDAARWREDARKWLREGKDPAEVRRLLAERIPGVDLTGTPGAGSWWVWVGLGVGLVGILWFVRRQVSFSGARPEPTDGTVPAREASLAARSGKKAKRRSNVARPDPAKPEGSGPDPYDAILRRELDDTQE